MLLRCDCRLDNITFHVGLQLIITDLWFGLCFLKDNSSLFVIVFCIVFCLVSISDHTSVRLEVQPLNLVGFLV